MDRSIDSAETLDRVEASLNYLAGTEQAPVLYASEAGPDVSRYVGNHDARTVAIHDARPVRDQFSLDRQGFVLLRHETAVSDLYDEEAVRSVYSREIEALLMDACGAAHVVVFDHTRRADSVDTRAARMVRDPAKTVHNDYTERSGPKRVRDLLPAGEAEARLRGRFAIVNVWRPIRGPVLRAPLALCDARTVAPEDLVAGERRAKGRIGEIYQAVFSPDHRWYYFPNMRPDEVLVFKTFDSATDGRARLAIHSAFDDPNTPPGAPPRESIETRAFVFF
jgi:hypothetical protein